MNRIIEPINIASLIFIIVTCLVIKGIYSKIHEEELNEAEKALVESYQANYQNVLDRYNEKLPMRMTDYLAPTITKLQLSNDTLIVICNLGENHYYDYKFENSSTEPATALLSMFKDGGLGANFVDCIMANNWAVRMKVSANQQEVEDYTFSHDDLVTGYLSHYYYDKAAYDENVEKIALKHWFEQQQKK